MTKETVIVILMVVLIIDRWVIGAKIRKLIDDMEYTKDEVELMLAEKREKTQNKKLQLVAAKMFEPNVKDIIKKLETTLFDEEKLRVEWLKTKAKDQYNERIEELNQQSSEV